MTLLGSYVIKFFITLLSAKNLIKICKIFMICFSVFDIEYVGNIFRNKYNQKEITLSECFFLTNISLHYSLLCLLVGLYSSSSIVLFYLYSFMLPTALVLEIIVVVMFWSMFLVDPSYVKNYIEPNTSYLKLCLMEFPKHLFPLLILIIEMQNKVVVKSYTHRLFFGLFVGVYFGICELLIFYKNLYLYPFLMNYNIYKRMLVFLFVFSLAIIFYELLSERVSFLIPLFDNTNLYKSKLLE